MSEKTAAVAKVHFPEKAEQAWLLAVLALIAGYVDAYTFLLYRVYGSFMSGNTTQAGLHMGQGDLAGAGYNFLPIPLFVAGVFAGTLLVHAGLGDRLRWLLGVAAALLSFTIAATLFKSWPAWLGIVALSLAMGLMNTSVTSVGPQKISIGYVSGTLNSLARHLAFAARRMPLPDAEGPADTHFRRAALFGAIWTSFVAGALLAGAATLWLAVWSLLFPTLILLGLAALVPALFAPSGDFGRRQGRTPGA